MRTKPSRGILVAFLLSCLLPISAQSADAPRISAVSDKVAEFVARKEVAGAVTLVVSKDKVLHLDATGKSDLAAGTAMQPDTIMWIASMTKPITGVAIMMLQDEGKLSIDDPVGKYIPELANLKTQDGKPVTITIRHLMTHTSGMAEATGEQSRSATKLADLIPAFAAKPVGFEPGSQWRYCQSSINTAARIVEIVSGKPFDQFLDERLFKPLGMKDTGFYLNADQLPRLAKSYRLTSGKLELAPIFILQGHDATSRNRYPAANGGLFSTAADYGRFCQMLLSNGTLDGKRYLSPEAVRVATTVQSGEVKTGFTPGNGWGIGFCVVRKPEGVTGMLSPGTFGHGGAFGTQAWVDPVKGLAFVLMVQRANFPNADASDLRKAFQETAVSAIGK